MFVGQPTQQQRQPPAQRAKPPGAQAQEDARARSLGVEVLR